MFRITGKIKQIEEHIEEKKKPAGEEIKLEISAKKVQIIAAESVEFKAGETKPVKIKKIDIPAKAFVILSVYAQHIIGNTVYIGEEIPVPSDSERSAEYATFTAIKDGEVKEGDLIGSLMMIYGE